MTDAEIKKALEKAINEYAAEDVGSPKYFKLIIAILDLFNRQQAEIEKKSQDFKELVSDYRTLQQSFDNLKGLYEDEKSKVEKAKEKSIYFAKELQTAKAEIERLQKENNQFADIGKMYSELKAAAIKNWNRRADNGNS